MQPPAIFDAQIGRAARVTPRGSLLTAEFVTLVGSPFDNGSTIDTNFWAVSNTGAGSAAGESGGIVTLTSGTANSGNGILASVRKGRYLIGLSNFYHGNLRIPATGGANSTRLWGMANQGTPPALQDGFYFNYDGSSSTLSVNAINAGGTPTTVSSGSFNGQVQSYVLDTNVHTYDILYNQSGAYFFIDGVLIHTLKSTTALLTSTSAFTTLAQAKNSASGTTSVSLEVWENSILRMGAVEARPKSVHILTNTNTLCKRGAGTLVRMVCNNPGTSSNTVTIYDGIDNTGTVLAVISGIAGTGGLAGSNEYDLDFFTGLFIVTATGTSSDWSVVYT